MSNRSGLSIWSWFLGALISLLLFYSILKNFSFLRSSVVPVPVQSLPVVQYVPVLVPSRGPSQSLPVPQQSKEKESQVVSTVDGSYKGYIESAGKRYYVYSPSVVSETYKYRVSGVNIKCLTVDINGVPFEAMLDTGASYVVLSLDAVRKLGIKEFVGSGIQRTASGFVPAYYFYASVKLGSFEIKDVKCSYLPSNPRANSYVLLGGSFLSHFNYSINESEGTVTFKLK